MLLLLRKQFLKIRQILQRNGIDGKLKATFKSFVFLWSTCTLFHKLALGLCKMFLTLGTAEGTCCRNVLHTSTPFGIFLILSVSLSCYLDLCFHLSICLSLSSCLSQFPTLIFPRTFSPWSAAIRAVFPSSSPLRTEKKNSFLLLYMMEVPFVLVYFAGGDKVTAVCRVFS